MSEIRLTRLPNGLRIITDHMPDVHSVALGVWSAVGTRDEDIQHNGVAHMVEHMLFKGSKKYDVRQIAEIIESAGGHMNAYTGREATAYHAHVLKENAATAMDILGDMYVNPTLPEEEIARERQVIVQEIGMSLDTPDDLVFDDFHEIVHPGQSLGAPILGRVPVVSAMSRDTMQDYIKKFYTPGRTVVSAAGNIDHEAFVRQVEDIFGNMPAAATEKTAPARYSGGEKRTEKALEQSHVVLGFQGIKRLDPAYYSAQALSTVMGSGMSSRLFQEVREKRGLAYSVFSFHAPYHDDGLFGIYAGTGPEKLKELIPVICDEVRQIAANLTEDEVSRARSLLRSGLLMSRESTSTRADMQAKYLMYRDAAFDLNVLLEQVEGITLQSVQKAAERIFATPPALSALGPLKELESFETIKTRLAA